MSLPIPDANLITLGGIQVSDDDCYEVLDNTGGSLSKCKGVRLMRVGWSDRFKLAAYLMGGSYVVAGSPFFSTGQAYPDNPTLVCQNFEPNGQYGGGVRSVGPNGMVAYQWANVKATYNVPQWQFGNPTLVGATELDFSSTAYSLSQTTPTFTWDTDPGDVPAEMVPSVRVTTVSLNITRYNMPFINYPLVFSLIDCVNSTPFQGAPAGHVRFVGGRSSRKFTATGGLNWDVSYSLIYQRQWGFNQLVNPATGLPAFFSYKNSDNTLFDPADLNQLFA